MKKIIEVTREDLKQRYSDNKNCPIAQALKREFKTENVDVFPSCVWINERRYSLSREADKKALDRADNTWGRIVGGFKFELEI